MFKKSKNLLKIAIVLFMISISLASCGGTVEPKVQLQASSLPDWYGQPISNPKKVYGVGIGNSDDALIDCLSKIAITVNSSVESKTKVMTKDNEITINKVLISKIVQKVKKTFISEYYIEKFVKVDNQIVVQISLKKKELIDNIVLNIISEENDLKSFNIKKIKNKNILFRINFLSNALEHSKKIDALMNMLKVLGKNYSINNKTIKYKKLLDSEYRHLKIYFVNNINAKIYNDMQMKVSKNFKKNIQSELLKKNTALNMTKNDIAFKFSSCAEAYTAIRGNKKFWQSGQIKVYKGCNKLTIIDNNKNELYSKRIAGIKIKDYESLDKASYDSYYSKESQQSLYDMLNIFSQHQQLKYLLNGVM